MITNQYNIRCVGVWNRGCACIVCNTFGIKLLDFSLLQNIQICCGAHIASCLIGRLFFGGGGGAVPCFALYAFLEWTGTIVSFNGHELWLTWLQFYELECGNIRVFSECCFMCSFGRSGRLSVKFFVTHVHILKMYFIKCFCWVMYWVQSYCQTPSMLYCGKSDVSDCHMLVKCIAMRGGGNVAAETACLVE